MLSVQGNYNLLLCTELFSMDCNGSLEGGGSWISKLDNHCFVKVGLTKNIGYILDILLLETPCPLAQDKK